MIELSKVMTNFLDQFDTHVLLFAIISLGKAHSEKSTKKTNWIPYFIGKLALLVVTYCNTYILYATPLTYYQFSWFRMVVPSATYLIYNVFCSVKKCFATAYRVSTLQRTSDKL